MKNENAHIKATKKANAKSQKAFKCHAQAKGRNMRNTNSTLTQHKLNKQITNCKTNE